MIYSFHHILFIIIYYNHTYSIPYPIKAPIMSLKQTCLFDESDSPRRQDDEQFAHHSGLGQRPERDRFRSSSGVVTGGGKASVHKPEFHWVNTMLGNVKSAIRSTHHSVSSKFALRYLAAFKYRSNLPNPIPRLAYATLRTPPMPNRLLKLG